MMPRPWKADLIAAKGWIHALSGVVIRNNVRLQQHKNKVCVINLFFQRSRFENWVMCLKMNYRRAAQTLERTSCSEHQMYTAYREIHKRQVMNKLTQIEIIKRRNYDMEYGNWTTKTWKTLLSVFQVLTHLIEKKSTKNTRWKIRFSS